MEHFNLSKTESEFRIEGAPSDAVKAVRIDGPKAKRLADFNLHKMDLEFAFQCLETINKTPEKPLVLRQALWRGAIIHFIKCFGDNRARSQLSAEKIFKADNLGMVNFNYFRDLRNKHFIHDENSYTQCIPGALLNNGNKDFKVEKIVCFGAIAETLEQNNFSNLDLLIKKARDWVDAEMERFFVDITNELEKESYNNLCLREPIVYKAPSLEEIRENRNSPKG